eukprot:Hpha_TRINITY_DN35373_c0_g1::TRINITY_DN35373_c0_g1_i1::g.85147::m.85147
MTGEDREWEDGGVNPPVVPPANDEVAIALRRNLARYIDEARCEVDALNEMSEADKAVLGVRFTSQLDSLERAAGFTRDLIEEVAEWVEAGRVAQRGVLT